MNEISYMNKNFLYQRIFYMNKLSYKAPYMNKIFYMNKNFLHERTSYMN